MHRGQATVTPGTRPPLGRGSDAFAHPGSHNLSHVVVAVLGVRERQVPEGLRSSRVWVAPSALPFSRPEAAQEVNPAFVKSLEKP